MGGRKGRDLRMLRVKGLLSHIRQPAGGKRYQSGLTDRLHELSVPARASDKNGALRPVVLIFRVTKRAEKKRSKRVREEHACHIFERNKTGGNTKTRDPVIVRRCPCSGSRYSDSAIYETTLCL